MICSACGHEHTGLRLAGICIGCACEHVVADILDPVFKCAEEPICATCDVAWPCPIVRGES